MILYKAVFSFVKYNTWEPVERPETVNAGDTIYFLKVESLLLYFTMDSAIGNHILFWRVLCGASVIRGCDLKSGCDFKSRAQSVDIYNASGVGLILNCILQWNAARCNIMWLFAIHWRPCCVSYCFFQCLRSNSEHIAVFFNGLRHCSRSDLKQVEHTVHRLSRFKSL